MFRGQVTKGQMQKSRRGVAAESTYEMAGCHFKVFYGKPDIYIYIYKIYIYMCVYVCI